MNILNNPETYRQLLIITVPTRDIPEPRSGTKTSQTRTRGTGYQSQIRLESRLKPPGSSSWKTAARNHRPSKGGFEKGDPGKRVTAE